MRLLMREFFEEGRCLSASPRTPLNKRKRSHKAQAKQVYHEETEDEDPVERRKILVRQG